MLKCECVTIHGLSWPFHGVFTGVHFFKIFRELFDSYILAIVYGETVMVTKATTQDHVENAILATSSFRIMFKRFHTMNFLFK